MHLLEIVKHLVSDIFNTDKCKIKTLRREKWSWKYNIKVYTKRLKLDWIHLPQNRVQWLVLVNTTMKFHNRWEFITIWATIWFVKKDCTILLWCLRICTNAKTGTFTSINRTPINLSFFSYELVLSFCYSV